MVRKPPYILLLAISIVLWCVAAWLHSTIHNFSPPQAANEITRSLDRQEQEVRRFITQYPSAIEHAITDATTPEEADHINKLQSALFIYLNDTLKYWSTNTVLPDAAPRVYPEAGKLVRPGDDIYWAKRITQVRGSDSINIVAFYPVVLYYPFENDYLISHFIATDRISPRAQVLDTPALNTTPFKNSGRIAGYLQLSKEEAAQHKPDRWVTFLASLASLCLLGWLYLISLYNKPRGIWIVCTALPVLLRLLMYQYGLPFEIDAWPLFSPQLYAASRWLPSLGDLLLNVLLLIWIIAVLALQLHRLYSRHTSVTLRFGIATTLLVILVVGGWEAARTISSIVLSSHLALDVAHLYTVDRDTISALIIISAILGATALGGHVINDIANRFFPHKYWKYLIIGLSCLLMYFTVAHTNGNGTIYWLFSVWVFLFVGSMDVIPVKRGDNLFSPAALMMMFFFCVSGTILLQYHIYQHERDTRKNFAEHILSTRDDAMEWAFGSISERIASDTSVIPLLKHPTSAARIAFNDRFNALYLNNELNNYAVTVYIYDAAGHPLANDDTLNMSVLQAKETTAIATGSTGLYYIENAPNDHDYLAHIVVGDDQPIAHIYLDLAHKKTANQTVLPELLQPTTINKAQKDAPYHYALYSRGRLVSSSADYPFAAYLPTIPGEHQKWQWQETERISALRYRPDANHEALVVRSKNELQAVFTLFSYLFGLQLIGALIIVICAYIIQWLLHRKHGIVRSHVTLRQRIQASMLGIVLLSFLIIAITTVTFFSQRYDAQARSSIYVSLQRTERAINQYLSDNQAEDVPLQILSTFPGFRRLITDQSHMQQADINLYDEDGALVATSQEDIYSKGILARTMNAVALANLRSTRRSVAIRKEEVGMLKYTSAYTTLLQPGGKVYGYLNIPFFSSQKDLDEQVSNILVALINLYAFIFLLSSLLALFTTRWLTRTLNVITQQFSRLNLKGNELLSWPYNDEIGVLVNAYNNMARKLEESAMLLAQNEREVAWREMAKQVAHEIKNPLTPMKLNLQHLQSAIHGNHPQLIPLTQRVADSLLEQIDNLTNIAEGFSNFAKLPEAKPEDVVLNDLLEKVCALYDNEPGVTVQLTLPPQAVIVRSDRSQLNRVFTNLLQNAVQAIPTSERLGLINIVLTVADGFAQISVADNGAGITDEVAERLFNPYFTTKTSGTGLGLAMTRKIVELWSGEITYETKVGVGTTFFVRLPVIDTEE